MDIKMLRNALCVSFILFLVSCSNTETEGEKGPPPINVGETLIGKWELLESRRNGKTTTTLEGTTFEFTNGNNLNTNFIGVMEETNYVLTDKQIAQRGGKYDIDYTIDYIVEDTLSLSTNLQGIRFALTMLRAANTPTDAEENLSEN